MSIFETLLRGSQKEMNALATVVNASHNNHTSPVLKVVRAPAYKDSYTVEFEKFVSVETMMLVYESIRGWAWAKDYYKKENA